MNSLNRALSILSYIANCDSSVSPQGISNSLNIPISTVYRLLAILINWEFITFAKQYGTYTIGAQSIKTHDKYYRHSLLMKSSRQEIESLAKKTKETVAIITSNLRETICVDMIESEQALRCSFVIGQGNTLVRGASAKTLLAFRDAHYQALVFEIHADQLQNSQFKAQLEIELQHIQHQGYGISTSEIDTGVLGISAPIFKGQEILAVVSLMAPEFRVANRLDDLIKVTQQTASNITKLINSE